jgi:hypothetical protein
MIQANELRLGNYVMRKTVIDALDNGNVYLPCDILMLKDCFLLQENWAFKPIPLAPEIIEKCGFKDSYPGHTPTDGAVMNKRFENARMILEINEDRESGVWRFSNWFPTKVPVKYLHQFQNIVFLLTGEELEINLS